MWLSTNADLHRLQQLFATQGPLAAEVYGGTLHKRAFWSSSKETGGKGITKKNYQTLLQDAEDSVFETFLRVDYGGPYSSNRILLRKWKWAKRGSTASWILVV